MLTVKDLTVRFGEMAALDGVDLSVATGEVMAVLGPSGSGKTTLLRAVAGLVVPDSGTVSWDGEDVTSVPVHRREFGLMFQDFALFPHKTVQGNVAFGMRMQRLDAVQIEQRVEAALARVGLEGFEDRSVGSLSGGQQQRVALARAIAPQPRLLMFDEPLGSLDRGLRERLVGELGEILEGVGITTLYVTHDQEEAFGLADRVVLLREGTVEQVASPLEMWSAPRTEFAARFLGFNNVVARDTVATLGWPEPGGGGSGAVVYRPDGFSPSPDGRVVGTVLKRTYRGDHFLVRLGTAAGPEIDVVVRWTPVPERGETLCLAVDPDGVFTVER